MKKRVPTLYKVLDAFDKFLTCVGDAHVCVHECLSGVSVVSICLVLSKK